MGPNHLSILGIFHTAISVLAILVALYALIRDGKIDPANGRGKWYIILTVVTCITAFPIMRFGHPTPGHYVAAVILVLLPIAIYAPRLFGKARDYVQVLVMSTTLFLSFIPAIVESLTRLPISSPLASGPNDPLVQKGQLILVIVFLVGVTYQVIKVSKLKKAV
jgi:hypothetical protein